MHTILVIEDQPIMRQKTVTILKMEGYEVLEAADGRDALGKLDGRKIHLIISDVNMPNMDGIELLSNLKANPSYKTVPVLMVTTEGSQAKVMQALELGAVGYVRKPFTAEEIKGKLTGII